MIDSGTPSRRRLLVRWIIVAVPGAFSWRFLVHPERDLSTTAYTSPHIFKDAEAALQAAEEWTVLEEWHRSKKKKP